MCFYKNIKTICVCFLLVCAVSVPCRANGDLPDGFVYLDEYIPGAVYEVRYYYSNNFVGERINGYSSPRVILGMQAAKALAEVQEDLAVFGLGLKFFDGYRPQRAVDHFVRWAKNATDIRMKERFYPGVDKTDLIPNGYIAARSGHSRGSTVDLTIVDLQSGRELDMGTPFDYFGPKSWPDHKDMPPQVRANRALLQNMMERRGFKHLKEEWWHFTLKTEPFRDTYFDFPVE